MDNCIVDVIIKKIANHIFNCEDIYVYDYNDTNHFFSNLSPHPICVDEYVWRSVEHCFYGTRIIKEKSVGNIKNHIFSKRNSIINFVYFNLTYHYQKYIKKMRLNKILEKMYQIESKDIRLFVTNELKETNEDWENTKLFVMVNAIYTKLTQHYEIRKKLLNIHKYILCQGEDDYWTIGKKNNGSNILGKILMSLRDEFNSGKYDELENHKKPLWLLYPNIPLFSIYWRMGDGENIMSIYSLWWSGLSQISKDYYIKMYPEPSEWEGWYEIRA